MNTLCSAPLVWRSCTRRASVLATDVSPYDPHGYQPVCKVHLREAITRGVKRAAASPAGRRVPVSILPLDRAGA